MINIQIIHSAAQLPEKPFVQNHAWRNTEGLLFPAEYTIQCHLQSIPHCSSELTNLSLLQKVQNKGRQQFDPCTFGNGKGFTEHFLQSKGTIVPLRHPFYF